MNIILVKKKIMFLKIIFSYILFFCLWLPRNFSINPVSTVKVFPKSNLKLTWNVDPPSSLEFKLLKRDSLSRQTLIYIIASEKKKNAFFFKKEKNVWLFIENVSFFIKKILVRSWYTFYDKFRFYACFRHIEVVFWSCEKYFELK